MRDLKAVYQADTRDQAETALSKLSENWSQKYAVAVRAWENNWAELSTFFDFPFEIRRLIYTNNAIEGYNRQLRKVTKNKSVFSTMTPSVNRFIWPIGILSPSGPCPFPTGPKS